jgi:rod shape determining protein RodA
MLAGLLTIGGFEVNNSYFLKQSLWIVVASIAFFAVSRLDLRFLKRPTFVFVLYLGIIFILFTLFIVGHTSNGAQSWLSFGGFSFQPADLAKLVVIILLAKYFSRRHIEIANIRHIIVSGIYVAIPTLLILLQPDFGSAVVVMGLWFFLVLISGISKKHLFALLFIGLSVLSVAWLFLFKPYQKERILNFIHPLSDIRGSGYNAYQSTIAVGSGGLIGKGLGYGTQSRLSYLPEYRTDFVFAAFAEEWGFIGSILIIILYALLLTRLAYFASLGTSNFETLFTYGVVVFILLHMVVNIGMNIGLVPVTGIPLPFMSYGGSHLLIEMIALGMCVAMERYSHSMHKEVLHNEFLGLE